jgi:broad specificity phosphatase PhoE
LVSSGGPISTAIGHVLGVPHQARIALNLQIRNSSVSEFHFSSKQHSLLSYNTLPHLDSLEHKSWITYA